MKSSPLQKVRNCLEELHQLRAHLKAFHNFLCKTLCNQPHSTACEVFSTHMDELDRILKGIER